MDERDALLRRLRDAGHDEQKLARTLDEGRLATLAVEAALGGTGGNSLTHVAREARLDPDFLRQLLQAVGRPNPAPRERILTDEDLEMARLVRRFLDAGLSREGVLEVARALSQGLANGAESVRRLVRTALADPSDSEAALGVRYAEAAEQLTPLVGSVLAYQFRVHLRDGMQRELVAGEEAVGDGGDATRDVTVAFADLVDYTALGERLAPEDIGRIAGRLGELATVAKRPVRLVKMIGDAAMFVSEEVPPLVDSMVALVKAVEDEGEDYPSVRVGVACGPATTRGGDWFGSTVNVASRLTGVAKPGRIFATEAVKEGSEHQPWDKKRRRGLKGVDGRVRVFSLEPAKAGG